MGDRANFGFRADSESPVVVLYAHWGGYQMMSNLANAIEAARSRWTDEGYATRIAISQLIGEEWNQELSYGIYVNQIGDNEHSVPVVNWKDQTVSLYEADWNTIRVEFDYATPKFTMGFDAFISKFAKHLTSV
jgi:hypothetical protein